MRNSNYDVVVFGSGINGCAIAAELAVRGLKVLNVDAGSIASGTSSNSTCLIHGGLRYLEQYNFSMVRKSLVERQSLLELAPFLVKPLLFVIPRRKNIKRPFWFVRLGLIIYDNLSIKNKLSKSKYIKRSLSAEYFTALHADYDEGLLYSDCVTDDARLTIIKALQAQEYGATILPYTKLNQAKSIDGIWHLDLNSKDLGVLQIKAKVLINATGSQVQAFAREKLKVSFVNSISLVKGSHIILPKLYDGEHAYLLQNNDKRVIFITPFHEHTMIGTTDVYQSDACSDGASISKEEIDYLIAVANDYFKVPINSKDILSTRCGLRVLLASPGSKPSALSRDYALELVLQPSPVLHVIGGKLTIHSQLAEQVAEKLREIFPSMPKTQRLSLSLPGSTLKKANGSMSFAEYIKYAKNKYKWLDEPVLNRYLGSYGTNTEKILASCQKMSDMGYEFAKTYYKVEIDYLIREEFVSNLHSLLWLNTKLGLIISAESKHKLKEYLELNL